MAESTHPGIVFDIKEFAIYDGPGMRCTVFMKGCPLRCTWCHNPEGIDPKPQTMRTTSGSRVVGVAYTPEELSEKLLRYAPALSHGGGVTFSGGEPLLQAAFVRDTCRLLNGKEHILLQTSGCAPTDEFLKTVELVDLVYFDIKIADPERHRAYTGRDNTGILANFAELCRGEKSFRLRMPLVPGVTDTSENYAGVRALLKNLLRDASPCEGVDLLLYNRAAGGKYGAVGVPFSPRFEESRECVSRPELFRDLVREVNVL